MKQLREYLVQERSYDGIRGNITLRNAYLALSSASLGVMWWTSSRKLRRTARTVTTTILNDISRPNSDINDKDLSFSV